MGSKYQDSPIFGRIWEDGHSPHRAHGMCQLSWKGVEFRGSLAPFFLHLLWTKKKVLPERTFTSVVPWYTTVPHSHTHSKPTGQSACQVTPVGYNHLGRVEIIGMNIGFWSRQGLRPKRKEPHNYLPENQIDILALNETFLKPKFKFHPPGYDIYKNDRPVGTKGGVAILVKKGIIVNQKWKNDHFNVITDNEALAIETELQNGGKVILATIYCPSGNLSSRLFRMINALSNQVIFLGDFNPNTSNLDVSSQTNLVKRLLT